MRSRFLGRGHFLSFRSLYKMDIIGAGRGDKVENAVAILE
jgi:hypothetical protein